MSVLTQKKALIAAVETFQVTAIIDTLKSEGVVIIRKSADEVNEELLDTDNIDFIVVGNGGSTVDALSLLRTLSSALVERAIPAFVLLGDNPDEIQSALSLGAADCLTDQEDVSSVLAKIKAVFGHTEPFGGGIAIDISTVEANVTKKGIRVYIVEDDPLLRNLLSLKLDKTHFPYAFSVDGGNIVSALRQFRPDIVILDLMLPGRTGFEVLADIKGDSSVSAVPVIVFSNQDSPQDRAKAKALGASGFYVKAMTDLSELIETIESVVK